MKIASLPWSTLYDLPDGRTVFPCPFCRGVHRIEEEDIQTAGAEVGAYGRLPCERERYVSILFKSRVSGAEIPPGIIATAMALPGGADD
jgi:hypothetical protein